MHACAFMQIWQEHIVDNFQIHLYLKFERKILNIWKVTAVLIKFLYSRASRAPTCMHVHEKWDRFRTSTQHAYSYLKGFNFIYWVVLWEHSRTKKLRDESRKKRIIIRNRVKTICSQTSFGEHNNKKQSNNNMFPNFVWGT